MKKSFLAAAVAVLLVAGLPLSEGRASVIFTAAGTGTDGEAISAQAEFDFGTRDFGSGAVDALVITLTNTAVETLLRGNLLTGLFFSLAGDVGPLTTTSAGFDGRAGTTKGDGLLTTTNVDIGPAVNNTSTDGTFQLNNLYLESDRTANNGADFSGYEYGLATVAYGLGGFNGAAVNSDDFGIFAPGSALTGNLSTVGRMIEGSATFWILKPAALTSLNQVTGVRFTYGSLPDNTINVVVEPAPLALLGLGLLGLAGITRVRRRKDVAEAGQSAPEGSIAYRPA